MKPFELLVWLPIVHYLDGITSPFTDLIGQNKDEVISVVHKEESVLMDTRTLVYTVHDLKVYAFGK